MRFCLVKDGKGLFCRWPVPGGHFFWALQLPFEKLGQLLQWPSITEFLSFFSLICSNLRRASVRPLGTCNRFNFKRWEFPLRWCNTKNQRCLQLQLANHFPSTEEAVERCHWGVEWYAPLWINRNDWSRAANAFHGSRWPWRTSNMLNKKLILVATPHVKFLQNTLDEWERSGCFFFFQATAYLRYPLVCFTMFSSCSIITSSCRYLGWIIYFAMFWRWWFGKAAPHQHLIAAIGGCHSELTFDCDASLLATILLCTYHFFSEFLWDPDICCLNMLEASGYVSNFRKVGIL